MRVQLRIIFIEYFLLFIMTYPVIGSVMNQAILLLSYVLFHSTTLLSLQDALATDPVAQAYYNGNPVCMSNDRSSNTIEITENCWNNELQRVSCKKEMIVPETLGLANEEPSENYRLTKLVMPYVSRGVGHGDAPIVDIQQLPESDYVYVC